MKHFDGIVHQGPIRMSRGEFARGIIILSRMKIPQGLLFLLHGRDLGRP